MYKVQSKKTLFNLLSCFPLRRVRFPHPAVAVNGILFYYLNFRTSTNGLFIKQYCGIGHLVYDLTIREEFVFRCRRKTITVD